MNTGEHGHEPPPGERLGGAQAWQAARQAWLDGSLTAEVQIADSCDGPSDGSSVETDAHANAQVPDELRSWLNTHRPFPRSVPLSAMVTYLIDQWTFDDVPKDTIKILGAGCDFRPVDENKTRDCDKGPSVRLWDDLALQDSSHRLDVLL